MKYQLRRVSQIPNRAYEKGARQERELVNLYRNKGCFAVRTAGSHSTVDVIAIEEGILKLIQVKGKNQNVKIDVPDNHILIINKFVAYKLNGKWVMRRLSDYDTAKKSKAVSDIRG